jgi:hypothetical protein
MGDGDIVVAMSVGSEQAGVDGIGVAAAEAVSEANSGLCAWHRPWVGFQVCGRADRSELEILFEEINDPRAFRIPGLSPISPRIWWIRKCSTK